jgi:hypothetical protein
VCDTKPLLDARSLRRTQLRRYRGGGGDDTLLKRAKEPCRIPAYQQLLRSHRSSRGSATQGASGRSIEDTGYRHRLRVSLTSCFASRPGRRRVGLDHAASGRPPAHPPCRLRLNVSIAFPMTATSRSCRGWFGWEPDDRSDVTGWTCLRIHPLGRLSGRLSSLWIVGRLVNWRRGPWPGYLTWGPSSTVNGVTLRCFLFWCGS